MILHLCKGESETNKTNGSGGPSLTFSHFGIECKIKAFWIWCHAKRQSHQALVVLLNNLTCTWKLNNIGHSCSLSLCLSSLDSFHWWFIASHFSCSKYLHFPFSQSNMLISFSKIPIWVQFSRRPIDCWRHSHNLEHLTAPWRLDRLLINFIKWNIYI